MCTGPSLFHVPASLGSCVQICASVSPGLGGSRAGWGVRLHPATADHGRSASFGFFFCHFLGTCVTTHRPPLEMLFPTPRSLPGTAQNPSLPLLCQELPRTTPHVSPTRFCPGHHSLHAPCPLLSAHTHTHTHGLCCSCGADPLANGISRKDTLDSPHPHRPFRLPCDSQRKVGVCFG